MHKQGNGQTTNKQINKISKHTKQLRSQQMIIPTNNQSKEQTNEYSNEWTNNPMNGNKYVQTYKMNVDKLLKVYQCLKHK